MCESLDHLPDVVEGEPRTYYNHPIAVLVGPACWSSGDIELLRYKQHPEARFFGKPPTAALCRSDHLTPPFNDTFGAQHCRVNGSEGTDSVNMYTHTEFDIDCPIWFSQEDVIAGEDTVVNAAISWIQGTQPDPDSDGVGDPCDNCPTTSNVAQDDTDNDGLGDLCDCSPSDPAIFAGSFEINDGTDNQCPGEPGHGLADELTEHIAFRNASEKHELSWFGQSGATEYEVARSGYPDFSSDCYAVVVEETYLVDTDEPVGGAAYYYLVRPSLPNAGSWGRRSSGPERLFTCP
jgi:hypothetical protein